MLCRATHRRHQPQRDGCDVRFRTGVKDPQITHERVEMVDGEPSSTTPELLSVQAIELEMPTPGIWDDRELDDRTTGLMLVSVRFPRPEVPACAMTLPLLAHAGFFLYVWGESLESAMKVPVPLRLDAQSSVGLKTQQSAKVAWFTESSTAGTTALS